MNAGETRPSQNPVSKDEPDVQGAAQPGTPDAKSTGSGTPGAEPTEPGAPTNGGRDGDRGRAAQEAAADPFATRPNDRLAVDGQVQFHGEKKFFSSAAKRAAFRQMSPAERQQYVLDEGWTRAALGFAVEKMGIPVVRPTLRPGETLLTNVLIKVVGAEAQLNLPDLDFVIFEGGRITRVISAKSSPSQVHERTERRVLGELVSRAPVEIEGPAGFKQWVRDHKKLNWGEEHIKRITGLEVWVDGARLSMSLAEFRAQYLSTTDVGTVKIEGLTPAHPNAKEFALDVTRDEIVAEIVASIGRRIDEIDEIDEIDGP